MTSFLRKYTAAFMKIVTSYPFILAIALITTLALTQPFVIGTNTGEDACVYTSPANKALYVKTKSGFVKYEPGTHGHQAKTYVTNGNAHYLNKPNWRVYDMPCRLTGEALTIGGILLWLAFVVLAIFRISLRKLLRIKN